MEEHNLSEQQLKFRQEVLRILSKNFDNNRVVYECANDWCSKQVTTNGLVSYCRAYYGTFSKDI